ncbi:MAG: pyridoxamine kinase [Lachnospiraceae bacterium]|nr:pyridoxamine kinase [Lachnospiraceae bacterium]
MSQKKIALFSDLTGFGRCATAVALPIISTLKVQCAPVPTSILSTHPGFPGFYMDDYTDKLSAYLDGWRAADLSFDGIAAGFLGSGRQVDILSGFIREFRKPDTAVIIDPVMGDHGHLYSTHTADMCAALKRLVKEATIITPNLTEACLLTDTLYRPERFRIKDLQAMAEQLAAAGPQKVVITGIRQKDYIANLIYEAGQPLRFSRSYHVGCDRPGTGDIFAAIIAAETVKGLPFVSSVKKASRFVKRCILKSEELGIPKAHGVCFEEVLSTLK